MFGFGKSKCEQCGMELKPDAQEWSWKGKKFCCDSCKQSYRHGKSKCGGCCH